jgi:hypothetical protein
MARNYLFNHTVKAHETRSRLTHIWKATCSRQDDNEFRELPGHRFDIDRAAVLFHDDVVAYRQAKPGTFTRWLGRKKRMNIFSLTSFGIPVPLSRMRISTLSPRFFVTALSSG